MQEHRRSDSESDHPNLVLVPRPIDRSREVLDDTLLDPWDRSGLTRDERARLKGPRSICLTDGEKHIQLTSPNHAPRGPERDEQLTRLQDCLDAGYQLVG